MFPPIDRNLPTVEENIISYLRPRDLLSAKLVCKLWRAIVRRYMANLGRDAKSLLAKEALLEPVSCYATITLPKDRRDITVNSRHGLHVNLHEASHYFLVPKFL